jgi:hypothetical protein
MKPGSAISPAYSVVTMTSDPALPRLSYEIGLIHTEPAPWRVIPVAGLDGSGTGDGVPFRPGAGDEGRSRYLGTIGRTSRDGCSRSWKIVCVAGSISASTPSS